MAVSLKAKIALHRSRLHPKPLQTSLSPPLWAHQEQTLQLARREPRVFDTSAPGTGKSRAHLQAFAERQARGRSPVCLIVAPKSLLKAAWYLDARRFCPQLRCVIAYATNREQAFAQPADVYILNTDGVKWLIKQPAKWLAAKFPPGSSLIVDEITGYKHRTNQRSKAIVRLAKLFEFRTGLTGTPNPRSVTELWHQLYLLDEGQRLGSNFFQFRAAVQTPVAKGPFTTWIDKPGSELAVAKLIADISIRHEFSDCMDIPPNFTYTRRFTPSTQLLDQYEEMRKHAFLELEQGDVKAVNAAVLQNKLLQIASGAVYDGSGAYRLLDTDRYELIADLIEEVTHSVTFFSWAHQKTELSRLLTQRQIPHAILDGSVPIKQREALVARYQAGQFQTLLLHPATGAHGLTLTKGTRTIWSSPIYQADFLLQGKHRIYRGGQTLKTETVLVEAEHTLEARLYEALNDKDARMTSFLDMIREK